MSVQNQNSAQVVTTTTTKTLKFTLPSGKLVRVEAGDHNSTFTVIVYLQLERLAPTAIVLIPIMDSGILEFISWDGAINLSDGWQLQADFSNVTSGDKLDLSALVET